MLFAVSGCALRLKRIKIRIFFYINNTINLIIAVHKAYIEKHQVTHTVVLHTRRAYDFNLIGYWLLIMTGLNSPVLHV